MIKSALVSMMFAAATLAMTAQATERLPPPSELCIDARQVSELHQPSDRILAITAQEQRHYLIQLMDSCPGITTAKDSALLAKDGWVCGGQNEYVKMDGETCQIGAIKPIDAKGFSAAARESDRIKTLSAVQVTANKGKGFVGSPEYCFAPRFLRSWSEDPKGLTVEVSRRHPGEHRRYRLELGGSCSDLYNAQEIAFRSMTDVGMICGNAGDEVVVQDDTMTPIKRGNNLGIANHDNSPRLGAMMIRSSCPVIAVYPESTS